MKLFIVPTYTFTPGASGVGTVNLSGISSFNAKRLVSIINQTRGVVIYATGSVNLRYTNVTGTTVTLFYNTATHDAGDILQVIYDDPSLVSETVAIDQTTPGTTNGVQVAAALPAGTNNIGDVDVLTLPALVAGTAVIGQVGIDQTTDGTTNKVQARNATHDNLCTNANAQLGDADVAVGNPVPISSPGFVSSTNFTRTADTTAYTALDVIGPASTANLSFTGLGNIQAGNIVINGISIRYDENAVPTGMINFKLFLYSAAPTAIADNAAYNLPSTDRDKFIGAIDIPTPVDIGDTCYAEVTGIGKIVKLAASSTTLYGILQTGGAFTPISGSVVTITLAGYQL